MSDAILKLSGISKAFAGIHAVREVNLSLGRGSILGLIGQNGAGKSTLVNIIGGVVRADKGTMHLDGADYAPRNPSDAVEHGISFIHQELNLFTNLSIAENIFLGGFPKQHIGPLALIDRRTLHTRTEALLSEVNLDRAPDTTLDRLSPGERQLVEVAKALQFDAKIIIFDEPTTSLTTRETDRLFRLIQRLNAAGKSIIYISHILADVVRLADHIAILRDGELTAAGTASDFTIPRMITAMVGRTLEQLNPSRQSRRQDRVILAAEKLAAAGILKDVSFRLYAGEVLGVFGLMGSGRTELARTLFGLESYDSGEITVNNRRLTGHSPRACIRSGVAFVTENRREEGLLMGAAVAENIALVALPKLSMTPIEFLDQNRIRNTASALAEALRIKTASLDQPVASLSGGNQQKVVIAKWLVSEPSVFLMDEPTRGIDVGAKFEIYGLIDRLTREEAGVLFISSELEELMTISDRILVMSRGEIVGTFERANFDRELIVAAAFREEGIAA
ncbi:MAG: sugar ABC transporter ATP-binding protein [Propylenella sp.]